MDENKKKEEDEAIKKNQPSMKLPHWKWLAIPFLLIIVIYLFCSLGLDKDEIKESVEENKIISQLYKKVKSSSNDLIQVDYDLNWQDATGGHPYQSKMEVPGTTFLKKSCKSDINLFNSPFVLSDWKIPVCDKGLLISRHRFDIESINEGCAIDEAFLKRSLLLLKFIDNIEQETINSKPRDSVAYFQEHILPSNLPDNLHLLSEGNKLSSNPFDLISWISVIFHDINWHFTNNNSLSFAIPINRTSQFKFNDNITKVKFGIKRFRINEFREIIKSSIIYEEVIASFDEQSEKWVLNSENKIIKSNNETVDIILEQEPSTRIILGLIIVFGFVLFFLLKFILRKIFQLVDWLSKPYIKVLEEWYHKQAREDLGVKEPSASQEEKKEERNEEKT